LLLALQALNEIRMSLPQLLDTMSLLITNNSQRKVLMDAAYSAALRGKLPGLESWALRVWVDGKGCTHVLRGCERGMSKPAAVKRAAKRAVANLLLQIPFQ
jgi:hypothetical protein